MDGVEVLTTADSVYVGRELDQGTFYDVVVYAVGDKERRNPAGSDILRVQTGFVQNTFYYIRYLNVIRMDCLVLNCFSRVISWAVLLSFCKKF